jgi:chemotaxis protein MotA
MIIPIGILIILGSVLGGFIWGGGHPGVLFPPHEFLIIGGAAFGALVIMSPKKVLIDLTKGLISCVKGAPHNREGYEQLLSALYELFLVGRRNGMIALEEHVMEPQKSAIFKKYPLVGENQAATEFLCSSLRPIIDGKVKPDQLRMLLDIELDRMETEQHAPVSVLTRAADAMPGFGIVAAVLGIVITMASISSGPIEHIGEGVAAALVGTFLGVFIAYGFLNPLATNLEFVGAAELDFTRCIAACIVGFANGMAPITAVEVGRRGLSSELRPSADELEQMLRSLKDPGKPSDKP